MRRKAKGEERETERNLCKIFAFPKRKSGKGLKIHNTHVNIFAHSLSWHTCGTEFPVSIFYSYMAAHCFIYIFFVLVSCISVYICCVFFVVVLQLTRFLFHHSLKPRNGVDLCALAISPRSERQNSNNRSSNSNNTTISVSKQVKALYFFFFLLVQTESWSHGYKLSYLENNTGKCILMKRRTSIRSHSMSLKHKTRMKKHTYKWEYCCV